MHRRPTGNGFLLPCTSAPFIARAKTRRLRPTAPITQALALHSSHRRSCHYHWRTAMAQDATLHVKLDSEIDAHLKQLAYSRRVSKGQLVREALAVCYQAWLKLGWAAPGLSLPTNAVITASCCGSSVPVRPRASPAQRLVAASLSPTTRRPGIAARSGDSLAPSASSKRALSMKRCRPGKPTLSCKT